MVTKKPKGLGRGLEALLGPKVEEKVEQAQAVQAGLPSALPLTELVPGVYQPRTRMDEGALYELAESIKAQGIMQPILVRRLVEGDNAGRYEIIAGERRFRAARLAGLDSVPVLVRDVPNEAAAAMALIENIQREDLNPLEEAQGIHRLIADFSFTHEQAATALGRSRSAVSNLLRLMNLASPVQTMLMAGDIGALHIAGGDQQRALHAVGVGRMRRPPGGKTAAQAVRHQHHGAVGIDHGFFQPCRPVAAQRAHPVVLLYAVVAVAGLPQALPVVGARVLPAGQQQNVGRLHYYCFDSYQRLSIKRQRPF